MSERCREFSYDALGEARQGLEGTDDLLAAEVLALSIVEDLRSALERFSAIAEDLGSEPVVAGDD